jgi:hypothetical protein
MLMVLHVRKLETSTEETRLGLVETCSFIWAASYFWLTGKNRAINPLLLLSKALLQGQKDRVSFSGHLIYILKQERFRAFRPAGGV